MCTAVPSAKGLGVIFRMKFFVVLLAICALTSAAEFSSTEQIYDSEQVNNNVTDDEKTNKTVCYDELGCFDDSIGHRLPSDPSEIPPTYLMFSAENPEVRMSWNDTIEDLRNKTDGFFDEEAHLIFITHGFGESLDKPWLWNLKNATLKAYPDARVVIIDWGQAAFLPLYKRAASNVPVIANMTIRLTMKLMEIAPTIKAKNIYFIGFSLGAQMAGYYSREFTKQTGTKIGRITSLDAAAPLFEVLGIAPRRGDADFVEAIHTSAGNNIVTGKVGYIPPYADIDFYPNGGVKQPGCSIFVIPCSHQRSIIYLTHAFDNLNECQFKGVRCATVKEANDAKCNGTMIDAYIGQKDIANYPRLDEEYHIVYMKTDSRSPFCRKD